MIDEDVRHDYPDSVEAQIAFVNDEWRERAEVPSIYSGASRLANTTQHTVTIHNGRLRDAAGALDLDTNGFVLARHRTTLMDFRSKEAVKSVYFDEMRTLILKLTGAADAFTFPFYQVRSSTPAHFFDAFSLYMHCDFSPDAWGQFAQRIIRDSGCSESFLPDAWDFALYNLWRPVGGEVQKDPLVLIDASTVARADIIDYAPMKDDDGKARAALPLFNPDQRFYYIPYMQPDEVLVFKQLDSRPDKALVCPHTSFVDPSARQDARERESIDIRLMCVYPK